MALSDFHINYFKAADMKPKHAPKDFFRPPNDSLHPFNLGLRRITEGHFGRFTITPSQEREVQKHLPKLDPAVVKRLRLDENERLRTWCQKKNVKMPGVE